MKLLITYIPQNGYDITTFIVDTNLLTDDIKTMIEASVKNDISTIQAPYVLGNVEHELISAKAQLVFPLVIDGQLDILG